MFGGGGPAGTQVTSAAFWMSPVVGIVWARLSTAKSIVCGIHHGWQSVPGKEVVTWVQAVAESVNVSVIPWASEKPPSWVVAKLTEPPGAGVSPPSVTSAALIGPTFRG